MICPAIPEKLARYHDPFALVEFTLFRKLSNSATSEKKDWPLFEATATSEKRPDLKSARISMSLDFPNTSAAGALCSDAWYL
jgi:hypothetical protein